MEKLEQIECKNKMVEMYYNKPVINEGGINSIISYQIEFLKM